MDKDIQNKLRNRKEQLVSMKKWQLNLIENGDIETARALEETIAFILGEISELESIK